ncbi:MAG: hypothetical protein OTJ97_08810, partial [SAR202 cluster bacterium]|nr:hypothetical protein [SAR202 cluster bacterium]
EWPELAHNLVTLLVVSLMRMMSGISKMSSASRYRRRNSTFGLSYFVSSSLAMGVRYLVGEDFRDNELSRIGGGGPELTLFMGSRIRPFVGGGLMYNTWTFPA